MSQTTHMHAETERNALFVLGRGPSYALIEQLSADQGINPDTPET